MIRDIRNLHKNAMKKLRSILPYNIKIVYTDNNSVIIPCTIADVTMDLLKYSEYTGKDSKIFNILLSDFIDRNAKIVDFMYVMDGNDKYQVQSVIKNGIYKNSIMLICSIYKGNLNG